MNSYRLGAAMNPQEAFSTTDLEKAHRRVLRKKKPTFLCKRCLRRLTPLAWGKVAASFRR